MARPPAEQGRDPRPDHAGREPRSVDGLLPHEAPRPGRRRRADRARVRRRCRPRRPRPGRPRAGPARVPQRQGRHPGRHRRRRPRHRRRGRHARHQLRVPRRREDLPAPRRAHRARRGVGRGDHVRRLAGRPALGPDQQGPRAVVLRPDRDLPHLRAPLHGRRDPRRHDRTAAPQGSPSEVLEDLGGRQPNTRDRDRDGARRLRRAVGARPGHPHTTARRSLHRYLPLTFTNVRRP